MTKKTLEDLKDEIEDFCDKRDWEQFHDAKELSIGISTEASELLEHFRFKDKNEVEEIMESGKRQNIEQELADVLYFVLRFSQLYEIDLVEILEDKMEVNREKYPVEDSKGRNDKYDEL